jgi:predicted phosphodiesterase
MRILAISDIHNLLPAVHELRAREANNFDALVVAGDFGSEGAQSIFDILSTFQCPVLYIRGNWDYQYDVIKSFGVNCFHIHNKSVFLGEWSVTGFDFLDESRAELAANVSKIGSTKSIVVTHDRLTKTTQDLAGVPLFLYGHHHNFEDKSFKGSRFVNVSALGETITVRPKGSKISNSSLLRNAVYGSYVIIEIGDGINIIPHSFHQDISGWVPLFKNTWPGKPMLDAPFKSGSAPYRHE